MSNWGKKLMAFALVITSSVSGIVQHPTSQVSAAVLGEGSWSWSYSWTDEDGWHETTGYSDSSGWSESYNWSDDNGSSNSSNNGKRWNDSTTSNPQNSDDDEYWNIGSDEDEVDAKLNKSKLSVLVGKQKNLKVKPSSVSVRWVSNNKNIATVDQDGVVKGKKAGTTKIKAICQEEGITLTCSVTVSKKVTQAIAYDQIMAMKNKYYEGKRWTNADYYYWKGINCNCYGCIAFAGIVSDKVFGKDTKVKTHRNFSKIKTGDHIRIGDYHSVVVLKKSGNQLTVAEGNYNSSIHWGRVITKRELQNSGFYVDTRY